MRTHSAAGLPSATSKKRFCSAKLVASTVAITRYVYMYMHIYFHMNLLGDSAGGGPAAAVSHI